MSHWICGSTLKTLLSGGFVSAALKRPAASVCPGISGRTRESLQLSNNKFGAKTYHNTERGCNPAIERLCLKVIKLVFSSSALVAAGAAASSLINSGVEPSVKHSHKAPPPLSVSIRVHLIVQWPRRSSGTMFQKPGNRIDPWLSSAPLINTGQALAPMLSFQLWD